MSPDAVPALSTLWAWCHSGWKPSSPESQPLHPLSSPQPPDCFSDCLGPVPPSGREFCLSTCRQDWESRGSANRPPHTVWRGPRPTHRQLFLQADAESLGVVGLQLLQGHPCLPDELVVAEFILITHGDAAGKRPSHISDAPDLPPKMGEGCSQVRAEVGRCGEGTGAQGGPTHRRVLRIMSSSVIP